MCEPLPAAPRLAGIGATARYVFAAFAAAGGLWLAAQTAGWWQMAAWVIQAVGLVAAVLIGLNRLFALSGRRARRAQAVSTAVAAAVTSVTVTPVDPRTRSTLEYPPRALPRERPAIVGPVPVITSLPAAREGVRP